MSNYINIDTGPWSNTGTWNVNGQFPNTAPSGGDNVFIIDPRTVVFTFFDLQSNNLTISKATLDVGSNGGGSLTVNGDLSNSGTLRVHAVSADSKDNPSMTVVGTSTNNDTIKVYDHGTLRFEQDVVNLGLIEAGKGGVIKFDHGIQEASFQNPKLVVNGGEIDVLGQAIGQTSSQPGKHFNDADLTGDGSILKFLGGGNLDVTFGNGKGDMLVLPDANSTFQYTGAIKSFNKAGDTIDLPGMDPVTATFTYNSQTDILHVSDKASPTAHSEDIHIVGLKQNKAGFGIDLQDDGHGGTLIVHS